MSDSDSYESPQNPFVAALSRSLHKQFPEVAAAGSSTKHSWPTLTPASFIPPPPATVAAAQPQGQKRTGSPPGTARQTKRPAAAAATAAPFSDYTGRFLGKEAANIIDRSRDYAAGSSTDLKGVQVGQTPSKVRRSERNKEKPIITVPSGPQAVQEQEYLWNYLKQKGKAPTAVAIERSRQDQLNPWPPMSTSGAQPARRYYELDAYAKGCPPGVSEEVCNMTGLPLGDLQRGHIDPIAHASNLLVNMNNINLSNAGIGPRLPSPSTGKNAGVFTVPQRSAFNKWIGNYYFRPGEYPIWDQRTGRQSIYKPGTQSLNYAKTEARKKLIAFIRENWSKLQNNDNLNHPEDKGLKLSKATTPTKLADKWIENTEFIDDVFAGQYFQQQVTPLLLPPERPTLNKRPDDIDMTGAQSPKTRLIDLLYTKYINKGGIIHDGTPTGVINKARAAEQKITDRRDLVVRQSLDTRQAAAAGFGAVIKKLTTGPGKMKKYDAVSKAYQQYRRLSLGKPVSKQFIRLLGKK